MFRIGCAALINLCVRERNVVVAKRERASSRIGLFSASAMTPRTFAANTVRLQLYARLQSRQFYADAGDAEDGGAMDADHPAREPGQDRRQGWPLRDAPDGRGYGVKVDV